MNFKGGLGNIMKQAQEMQAKMQQAQKEIAAMKVTGEAGGGLVKVVLSGQHKCEKVDIALDAMKEGNEVLADLVRAAFNIASDKVEAESKKKLMGLTAGLELPGDLGGGGGTDI